MPTDGERTVNRLLAAYQRLDADGMLDCFTEDGAYHAMGMESAGGKDALRALWSEWTTKILTAVSVEVIRQLADDTIVMHERMDRAEVGDRKVVTPVAAMFDIDANGLITDWREYFDDPRTP